MAGRRSGRGPAASVVALVLVLLVATAGVVIRPPAASAATALTVTTTADVTDPDDGLVSLREAVAATNNPFVVDTIVLAPGATYALTQCPNLGQDPGSLRFEQSPPGDRVITLEGNGSTIRQDCASYRTGTPTITAGGVPLTLRDVTIADGGEGVTTVPFATVRSKIVMERSAITGATKDCIDMKFGGASLTMRSTRIVGCGGAGIAANDSESFFEGVVASMEDSEITGVLNHRGDFDGAAAGGFTARNMTLVRSNVHDNPGGGGWVIGAVVTSSHVDRNGGEVAGLMATDLKATDSTFDDNVAEPGSSLGATVAGVGAWEDVTLTRTSISRNRAASGAHGGSAGLWIQDSFSAITAALVDVHVDDNVVEAQAAGRQAAGIRVGHGGSPNPDITFTRSTVSRNAAADDAGIYSLVPVTLIDSTIAGNSVTAGGTQTGVGSVVVMGKATLRRTTVADNAVRPDVSSAGLPSAGGIVATEVDIDDTTVVGNTGDVGGVAASKGAITRSTFADNLGTKARQLQGSANVTVAASSFSSPAGTSGAGCVGAGPGAPAYVSGGYVFWSDSSCAVVPASTDIVAGGDPRLGPLTSTTGPTATRAPLSGSPLRDRIPTTVPALCSGTDQRGVTRPQGTACDIGAVEAPGSRFHPTAPKRILDSRTGDTAGFTSPLTMAAPRPLTVTGGDVPARARAVVLNVTATGSTAGSYLNVWPAGTVQPTASSLNFGPGQTIPNLVTAKVGTDGQVLFATNAGQVDVVVDLFGWFGEDSGDGDVSAGGWTGIDPARMLDTRTTTGGWSGPLAAGLPEDLKVTAVAGIPADATAIVANVTATGADSNSFLTLWPAGSPKPASSNLNFAAGETIANGVVIPVGPGGKISIANARGTTDLVVDVTGYFTPGRGSWFFAVAPTRALDDRLSVGASGPWQSHETRAVTMTGGPVPSDAVGVVTNVTVTDGTLGSYLSVFPHATAKPSASSINFGPRQTIANQTMVRVSGEQVDIFNQTGTVDVIADVVGYYAG